MIVCPPCNRRLRHQDSLNQHLAASPRHAHCPRCIKGFQSMNAFRCHLRDSGSHSGVSILVNGNQSDRAGNAVATRRQPAANIIESPLSELCLSPPVTEPYDGVASSLVNAVFAAAMRLRYRNPAPEDVIRHSRTTLNRDIVSAILEGALRLIPAARDPKANVERQRKEANKRARALAAELAFVQQVRQVQTTVLTEFEQRKLIRADARAGRKDMVRVTPDVLFAEPTMVCGMACRWIEYKNTFGFRENPFVASKHKAQLRKYVSELGPGMVVFTLGFEHQYLQIEGVGCYREVEVLQWLEAHQTPEQV